MGAEPVFQSKTIPVKWILLAISIVLIPLVSWLLVRDHDNFLERDNDLRTELKIERQINTIQAAELVALKEQHAIVARDIASIREDIRTQNEMMVKLLVEIKKRGS